jgi:hypothetical protein
MGNAAPLTPCDGHPAVPAAWRCRHCGAGLCPDCTYLERAGTAELPACLRCRGLAEPLRVHRAARRSFAARLPETLAFPVAGGGWKTLLAAATIFWLLDSIGGLGSLFAFGLEWGLFFAVVRRSSHVLEPLEPPGFDGLLDDVYLPAFRGLLASAIVWTPAILWITTWSEGESLLAPATWLGDPVVWLLILLGLLWAPAAIIAAAVSDSTLRMLDPRVPIGMVVRLGSDYALLLGFALALTLVRAVLVAVTMLVHRLPVPLLPGFLAELLSLYTPLVLARAAGLLLHVRGDAVGYGHTEDYFEPVWPGAVPRAAPPPSTPPVEAPRRFEAIELPDEPAPTAAPPPPAAVPATPEPQALFDQARAAATAGEYERAAELLRAAVADEHHPVTPGAWLVLGRLYRRRLGQPEAARQVFEYVAARWPDGEPARLARAALAEQAAPAGA